MTQWETVIGLEVHAQLLTQSKIFSGAATAYGAPPNHQACAIDLGMPGVLPVLNKEVLRMAVKFGLATDCTIAKHSVFERKNYFYPDLPKGYQISQYLHPIVHNGKLDIPLEDGSNKTIGITRAHLEEDAGKSLHEDFHGRTGVDLNRAGTPLLEIVSEPDLRSAKEAVSYLKALHTLVTYLGICDGNLQEGSFRCDANVSIRPIGESKLGTRTELKNINSFRFVEKAINYEVERQIALLESGHAVTQETRLYDPDKHETRPMRSKEEANDYRYFPDPDLLPIMLDDTFIKTVQGELAELPAEKLTRFEREFKLTYSEAEQLVSDLNTADYFEQVAKTPGVSAKQAVNWITGELTAYLNKSEMSLKQCPVSSSQLAQLLQRLEDKTLSSKTAKTVFEALWEGKGEVDTIIETQGLQQMSDSNALQSIIDEILANNLKQVAEYQSGKEKIFGFLVGQVMKATQGRADPHQVKTLLIQSLKS